MSLEECKKLAEERRKEERWAFGMVDGERVGVFLCKDSFTKWRVGIVAYREVSREYFDRRESADSYFEELVQKYGLEEEKVKDV